MIGYAALGIKDLSEAFLLRGLPQLRRVLPRLYPCRLVIDAVEHPARSSGSMAVAVGAITVCVVFMAWMSLVQSRFDLHRIQAAERDRAITSFKKVIQI